MDILEKSFYRDPEGWKHLYRLSKCRSSIRDLPEDSLEFFVGFAKSMLELRDQLKNADRGHYNSQVIGLTAKQLRVTKQNKGRVGMNDMSRSEFLKSVAGRQASMVENKLRKDPFLLETEAIEEVAGEYESKKGQVDKRTIERAWRDTKKRQDRILSMAVYRPNRQLEQAQYLAETLANKPHIKTVSVTVKLPDPVRSHFLDLDENTTIVITTRMPRGEISNPDCFFHDSEEDEDEPLKDSYTYLAHALAQCISLDGDNFTLEDWNGFPLAFNRFIAEQFLAKLERREPRKTW